ncbi:unnamed protein product [Phytomonas sp. EM1]|nr:unnamed protein product [Phytomonas sp. EM1]|eukprot:CCW62188.1 unnamed protein product [Phytomonas sp. isolate EM1]
MSATAITNPVTPLGKPLPPHVDNVTVVEFTFFSTRYLLAAQSMADDGEDPFLAEGPSRRPRDEEDPSKGSQSAPGASPEYLFFVLGHWQPFLTERGGARMGLVDPAGDVDLPRRALVRPFSTLHRGGGRLQWPIRGAGKSRFIEIPTEDEESGKKRILSAVNGNASKAIEIPVLYQTNSPDGVAVHVYSDGDLRCEADPLLNLKWNPEDDEGLDSNTGVDKKREHDNTRPHRSQTSLVSFVCHPEDEILRWALNGKCNQEIVVGTPSACTRWVLDEAERQVSIFKKVAQQYESES